MKSITCLVYILFLGGVLGSPLISSEDLKRDDSLKIIGGDYTTINKYPIDVAVLVENNIWGVGVILNKNWILTTAFNCLMVDPSYISVRVGGTYWSRGGTVFQAESCIMHPNYNGTWDYDIAVIKVSGNIKFNKNARAASLPKKGVTAGNKFDVSGWGVHSSNYTKVMQLQKTSQTILSEDECHKIYNTTTGTNFCASNHNAGPCVFDFGAPLNAVKTVRGLYQGSIDCTQPQTYPSFYTDVFPLTSWIRTTIANKGGSLDSATDEHDE